MRISLLTAFLLIAISAFSQSADDLLGADSLRTEVVRSTFKSTRVINSHSVEMLQRGNLDFRILHRFGRVNEGISQLFGLDQASMRMGFDYGLTNRFSIGIGRSTYRKELDAFLKTAIVQQTTGAAAVPVSLIGVAGTTLLTERITDSVAKKFANRTGFYGQAILGRKFSTRFSVQLSSLVVHRNYVRFSSIDNTLFALGTGMRLKVSKRVALMADYHYAFGQLPAGATQPLSVGVDIETGGHVFQLHFSNAVGMNERAFITETTDKFFNGDIRFGFNLSRMFQTGRRGKNW